MVSMMNGMALTPTKLQDINLHEVRNTLEDERARLIKQLHKEPQGEQDVLGRNPDRFDLANSFTSLVERSVRQTMDQKKLSQIEAALQRLEAGLYGRCAACDRAIEAERLAILPSTTHCIGCQQSTAA